MKHFLLTPGKNPSQSSVFWNMLSSGLNSIVSIILLLFVTRIVGPSDAGVFSLGFSTAQMMLTIGNYGMRNYQATDVKNKYSLGTYLASRIITSCGMILFTCLFLVYKNYYPEKSFIILLLVILKVTDAFDDLYGGYYQGKERLDISGKIMFFRVLLYSTGFIICLILTKNVVASIIVAIVLSSAYLTWMVFLTKDAFTLSRPKFQIPLLKQLLVECLPLCIGSFLLIYIGNAPKYAIDAFISDKMQAYYTYIFMPCFVINLFVGFALQPMLVHLSVMWSQNRRKDFLKMVSKIFGCALLISALIIIAGRFFGCPLLSWLFGVNLSSYTLDLTTLLIGGAFFSFAVIGQVILTIMRKQYALLWGFGIASLLVTVISPVLVKKSGLLGASLAYTISSGVLFIIICGFIFFYYKKTLKNSSDEFSIQ